MLPDDETQLKSLVLENEHLQITYNPKTRIYVLTFKDGSHEAVDAWMDYCQELMGCDTDVGAFRMLVIHTVKEELPFRHVRERVQTLMRSSSMKRPPFYTAIVRQNTWVTGMVVDFFQLLTQLNRNRTQHDRIKFFDPKNRAEAETWLQTIGNNGKTGPLTRHIPRE